MYTVIKFQTETKKNNLGEQNVRWDFWFFLFTLKQFLSLIYTLEISTSNSPLYQKWFHLLL